MNHHQDTVLHHNVYHVTHRSTCRVFQVPAPSEAAARERLGLREEECIVRLMPDSLGRYTGTPEDAVAEAQRLVPLEVVRDG